MGGGYPENKEIHRRLFQLFENRSENDIDNEKIKKKIMVPYQPAVDRRCFSCVADYAAAQSSDKVINW